MPSRFWPFAIRHAAHARNVVKKKNHESTAYFAKHGVDFPGKRIPFGTLVNCVPPPGEHTKFEGSSDECLFLYWHLNPGLVFQDYVVMPLHSYLDGTFRTIRTKDIQFPAEWKFPLRELARAAAAN